MTLISTILNSPTSYIKEGGSSVRGKKKGRRGYIESLLNPKIILLDKRKVTYNLNFLNRLILLCGRFFGFLMMLMIFLVALYY